MDVKWTRAQHIWPCHWRIRNSARNDWMAIRLIIMITSSSTHFRVWETERKAHAGSPMCYNRQHPVSGDCSTLSCFCSWQQTHTKCTAYMLKWKKWIHTIHLGRPSATPWPNVEQLEWNVWKYEIHFLCLSLPFWVKQKPIQFIRCIAFCGSFHLNF